MQEEFFSLLITGQRLLAQQEPVLEILEQGLDPDAKSLCGVPALVMASKFGLLRVVERLLLLGADVEQQVGPDLWSSAVCGVVWCGVVWCGVVWCGVVWCGVVWCGVVWCGVVWCGVVWCGVVWCGVVWCGVVWCGVVWCGVVWCGVVWCGVVWCGVAWAGIAWHGVAWCAEGAVIR